MAVNGVAGVVAKDAVGYHQRSSTASFGVVVDAPAGVVRNSTILYLQQRARGTTRIHPIIVHAATLVGGNSTIIEC